MKTSRTKRFSVKEIKGEEGIVQAVLATLNVIDFDKDVTLPGAFGEQSAPIMPAHNWNSVALGKAAISEDGDEALIDLHFNLANSAGRDWYSALKFDFENGPPLQQYSYGYDIEEAESGEHEGEKVQFLKRLKVNEVSPVLLGAGINTRTLAVKSGLRRETRFHLRAKQKGELSHRELEQELRRAGLEKFGKPNSDIWIADIFEDYLVFEQYFYDSEEGKDALYRVDYSVSAKTVSLGDELTEVRREVRFIETGGKSLRQEFEATEKSLADLSGFHGRVKELAALRSEAGRTLSDANRKRLKQLLSTALALQADLEKLLDESDPDAESRGVALFVDYQRKRLELDRLIRL